MTGCFKICSQLLSTVFVILLLGITPISSSAEQVSEISETRALSTGESLFLDDFSSSAEVGRIIHEATQGTAA